MGTSTLTARGVDCGEGHPPAGQACPGHTVAVSHHRSSDMLTLAVDGERMVLTEALFRTLREAMREVMA